MALVRTSSIFVDGLAPASKAGQFILAPAACIALKKLVSLNSCAPSPVTRCADGANRAPMSGYGVPGGVGGGASERASTCALRDCSGGIAGPVSMFVDGLASASNFAQFAFGIGANDLRKLTLAS